MLKSWWKMTFALAALVVAGPAAAGGDAKVGQPAPKFSLTTYSKQKIKLEDLKGKVVVINWWATWCGPCKAEMPMMSTFHRQHKDEGFEIFGVTTEDSVPPYMLKRVSEVLSYPLVLRFSGNAYPIMNGVPTSYVIDRHGVVRYAKAGSFSQQEFDNVILPLLREPAT
jgi:cytochrome c biogenesis protein CcmG/thiol:disulfide interchange protein DsbE